MTTNETNVLDTTNDTTNETSLVVTDLKKTDDKKDKKVLSQREILSQRQKNSSNVFDYVNVFDSKINEKLKNYTILQMCNTLELIKMSYITDLLFMNNFVTQVFKIVNEVKVIDSEKNEKKLRDVLFSYNVKKIENVTKSREEIFEIYKKFSNVENSKITIENFEVMLSEYSNLRKLNSQDENKFSRFLTVENIVKSCFTYTRELSNYTSKKDSVTENFQNIFSMYENYNYVRNIHVIHELYKIFCKNVTTNKFKTDEQKKTELNLLKKSYVLYFSHEQLSTCYNANLRNEVSLCKTTYLENFKKFHKSDKYEKFVEERSELNYLLQLEKLIEENFNLYNTNEFILFVNNNREKYLTVK